MATIEACRAELKRESNRWNNNKLNFEFGSVDYKRARRSYYEGIHIILEKFKLTGTNDFHLWE